jgi:ParB/RepB/Spo0J family partition protein
MESTIMIKEVDINSLKPHPKNIEIYGNEDIKDLVDSIRQYGLKQPIMITDKNVIISGHRRVKACKQLGYLNILATINHYDADEDAIEDLVLINKTRDRTPEQKAREIKTLEDIEKRRAQLRIIAKQNNNSAKEIAARAEPPTLAGAGRVRDILADKVGFKSGREAERAMKAVEKIDELSKKTDKDSKEKVEILRDTLNNKSVSTAEELTKYIDDINEVEKEEIKTGKMTPYKFITEAKKKKESKEKDWGELTELKKMADEYVAYSNSGEQLPLIQSNIIIQNLKTSIASFNAAIAQILTYERELKSLTDDEKKEVKNILNNFENQYFKSKNNLIKE